MTDALDFVIIAVLLILLGLVMKFVLLVRQLDQTKVARYCQDPPSIQLTKGQFSDKIPSKGASLGLGIVKTYIDTCPPADTEIKFIMNC
jgi:hypothetical protein